MKTNNVFLMKRPNWIDTWELHISKTLKGMHRHILQVYPQYDIDDMSRVIGCVQYHEDGVNFAYMFLNWEHITPGLIAHECYHLAMAHERYILKFGMDYGDEYNENEERVAAYIQDSVDEVYEILSHEKLGCIV